MKRLGLTVLNMMILLSLCACGKPGKKDPNESPAFMVGCYREEVVTSEYKIPSMTTPQRAAYIENTLKKLRGYVDSSCDLSTRTLQVKYQSSKLRKMNIEETIAFTGFAVNDRPANPKAQLPKGI